MTPDECRALAKRIAAAICDAGQTYNATYTAELRPYVARCHATIPPWPLDADQDRFGRQRDQWEARKIAAYETMIAELIADASKPPVDALPPVMTGSI